MLDMSAFGMADNLQVQPTSLRPPATPSREAHRGPSAQQAQQQGILFPPCSASAANSQHGLLQQHELSELQQLLSAPAATADAEGSDQPYGSSSSSSSPRAPAEALASLDLTAGGAEALLQLAAALTQHTGQRQQAAAFGGSTEASQPQQHLGLNLDRPALQFLALARLAAAAHQEQAAASQALKEQELSESVARVFQPVTVTRSSPALSQSGAGPPAALPPEPPRSPPSRLLLPPSPGATTPRSRSPLAGSGASPSGAAGRAQPSKARSARSLGQQSTRSLQSALSFSSLANLPGAPASWHLRRALAVLALECDSWLLGT